MDPDGSHPGAHSTPHRSGPVVIGEGTRHGLTVALIVWLILGLAVAVLVGAGVHGPGQPRRTVLRYVGTTHTGRTDRPPRTEVPRLYVVDRSRVRQSHARGLVLPTRTPS